MTARAPVIAVVDDDRSIRVALSSLLRSSGYDVDLYESAEAYLAASRRPDCLITDVQMPNMNGLELLGALASDPTMPPVVVITAFPEAAIRQRARHLGVVAFLSKPFDAAAMLSIVQDALSGTGGE